MKQTDASVGIEAPSDGKNLVNFDRPSITGSRNTAVDTMRIIAVLGVICLHAKPFSPDRLAGYSNGWQLLYTGIVSVSRFAVPFFFCVSGYFWGKRIRSGAGLGAVSIAMFKRIAVVFGFWSAFYLLVHCLKLVVSSIFSGMWINNFVSELSVLSHPIRLLLNGTAYHLWYLPALLCALVFSWSFLACKISRFLFAASIVLYVFAVLARAYSETSFGISPHVAGIYFDTRNGPFFSTIFFVTGYQLSAHLPRPRWAQWGLALIIVGSLLHLTEIRLIETLFHAPALSEDVQDFVFGTYAMGLGATMVALAKPDWLSSIALARWGRLTLGIYCVHLFFISMLWSVVVRLHAPAAEAVFPFAVLLLSIVAANLLSKMKLTRPLVQ